MTDFIFNQIFKGHRWLWLADSFSRYEQGQETLRGDPSFASFDQEEVHSERFRSLLPLVLSDDDLDATHPSQHDEILERLVDIENTYRVFRQSIDFDVRLGNSLKRVLAKPRKPGPRRDLLSNDQFAQVSKIVSSIDHWEGSLDGAGSESSFWATLYEAQREINDSGQVSHKNRAALNALNAAKPKKKRTYARQLLLLLLAEFFDEFSGEDVALNISGGTEEAEHDAKTEEVIKEARVFFDSPFSRFVLYFHELVGFQEDLRPGDEALLEVAPGAIVDPKNSKMLADAAFRDQDIVSLHFSEQAESKRLVHEWRISQRHKYLGYERSLLEAWKSRGMPRISNSILRGASVASISDVFDILDSIKPQKKKSK